MPRPNENSITAYVGPLIVLHLAIAIPLAYYLNIWSDEGSTLYSTQRGFIDALQHAGAFERQAPLYFWLMSVWRMANGSIFFARVFSMICCVAAIWFFARFVGTLISRRSAILATAFFALHPVTIWASTEARVYALVILLSTALLTIFFEAFFHENEPPQLWRKRLAYLALAIIALYTNYYLGFLLVGCFAALLTSRRWLAARDYFGLMAAAGLVFVPQLIAMKAQFADNTRAFHEDVSIIDVVRGIWGHVLTFVLPADIIPQAEAPPVSLARLWLVRVAMVVTGIVAFARRERLTRLTFGLGAVSAVIILGLGTAYLMLGSWLVALRHATVLFVPLALFLTSLIKDLYSSREPFSGRLRPVVVVLASLIVAAFFTYSLVNRYPHFAKPGDWERVGTFIEQNESPDQPIIIYHTYDALAMPYHYQGINIVRPDERFLDFDFGNLQDDPEHIRTRTDFTISKIPTEAHEIWLIVNNECEAPHRCDYLENFVQANYNVIKEQNFYLQNVRLLRKKTP